MCCKLRKQSQHSQPQSETSGKSIWLKKLDWYFLFDTHTFKIQQSFPLTEPLCFILSDKKVIFSAQKKSNVCCYGNCAYQCVWLKVCLTGIMAQTSFWSPILSHCSLVKSFSYFCAFLLLATNQRSWFPSSPSANSTDTHTFCNGVCYLTRSPGRVIHALALLSLIEISYISCADWCAVTWLHSSFPLTTAVMLTFQKYQHLT